MNDIFTDHYRLLSTDPAARQHLQSDPKAGLAEHFGSPPPAGDYDIEIIEQRSDTMTMLLPTPPAHAEQLPDRLAAVDGRIYDILHTTGIGGYLIPHDGLTWVLRDMRSTWAAAEPTHSRESSPLT